MTFVPASSKTTLFLCRGVFKKKFNGGYFFPICYYYFCVNDFKLCNLIIHLVALIIKENSWSIVRSR